MYKVWHVDKYKITFTRKLFIRHWTNEILGALLWFRGTYFPEQKSIYSQINAGQNKCNLVSLKSTNDVNCTLSNWLMFNFNMSELITV
jgi:hypothetical protein